MLGFFLFQVSEGSRGMGTLKRCTLGLLMHSRYTPTSLLVCCVTLMPPQSTASQPVAHGPDEGVLYQGGHSGPIHEGCGGWLQVGPSKLGYLASFLHSFSFPSPCAMPAPCVIPALITLCHPSSPPGRTPITTGYTQLTCCR